MKTPIKVIQRGWETLIQGIGHSDALRFIMSFSIGGGDSVKFYRQMWGDKTIEEIHQEILKTKKEKKL